MFGLPVAIETIIAVIIALIVFKFVSGLIVRVIVLVALGALLFYIFKSGAHEMILAPGIWTVSKVF